MPQSTRQARHQRAEVDGQNNIVVQIEGDRNTVNLRGFAHLTLTRYLTRRRIESDADLLSPYSRSIPLIGREPEMTDLRAWLASDRLISVRVLTGRAGAGKTRLAIELCEETLNEGWDAGFIESGELVRFRDQQNATTWGWQRPTLVVIDYVAVHAERLSAWLRELADNPGQPGQALRLLLLERHADTASRWWQITFGRGGWGAKAVQKMLDPAEPVSITPITDVEARREVLREVLREKGAKARPPENGADTAFDQELRELSWGGDPLFLMMAGVIAADRNMGQVLSLGRTDLAFELAERELCRIAEIGKVNGIDPDFLPVMAGYVTLCQGLERAVCREAVEPEKTALGLPNAGDPGKIATILCDALRGSKDRAEPILPDMIGEAAMIRAFALCDDRGGALIHRAFQRKKEQVAATLVRTAQDYGGIGDELPIQWLDGLIEERSHDVGDLTILANLITVPPLQLAAPAMRACATVFFHLQSRNAKGIRVPRDLFLGSVVNASHYLSALGQYKQALEVSREAVGLCAQYEKELSESLALALLNLSTSCNRFGYLQESREASEKAVEILRKLAAKKPQAYLGQLARALDNLSADLAAINLYADGHRISEEAVSIFSQLYEKSPDEYSRDLAMSLNNLGGRLGQLGRFEEAAKITMRCMDLLRPLAIAKPDIYSAEFMVTLANHACVLRARGSPDRAAESCSEAIEFCSRLGSTVRALLRGQLATCQMELCESLGESGQISEALGAAEMAIELFTELEQKTRGAFGKDLSRTHSLRSVCLSVLGREMEALQASRESVVSLGDTFFACEEAVVDLMASRCRHYLQICSEMRREPDVELLLPILEKLGSSQGVPAGRQIVPEEMADE